MLQGLWRKSVLAHKSVPEGWKSVSSAERSKFLQRLGLEPADAPRYWPKLTYDERIAVESRMKQHYGDDFTPNIRQAADGKARPDKVITITNDPRLLSAVGIGQHLSPALFGTTVYLILTILPLVMLIFWLVRVRFANAYSGSIQLASPRPDLTR